MNKIRMRTGFVREGRAVHHRTPACGHRAAPALDGPPRPQAGARPAPTRFPKIKPIGGRPPAGAHPAPRCAQTANQAIPAGDRQKIGKKSARGRRASHCQKSRLNRPLSPYPGRARRDGGNGRGVRIGWRTAGGGRPPLDCDAKLLNGNERCRAGGRWRARPPVPPQRRHSA